MKNPPMRMLILLAVFWGAGTLLLAAESPSTSTTKPAATAKKTEDATKSDTAKPDAAKTDATKTDAAKADTKEAGKDGKDSGSGKPTIAEQAEAALKAAYEADPKEPAKADPEAQQHAKDDTQTSPAGNAPKGPSPQRFVPSEQVRADFDVSFPIDI